jgi:hypothetical protein
MSKQRLIAGFLGLGTMLLLLSLFFAVNTQKTWDTQSLRLARAERETGRIYLLRNGMVQKEEVEVQAAIYNLDSIETNDTGEVSLFFEGAVRIQVLNNALVTLESDAQGSQNRTVLYLKRGEIKVETDGPTPQVVIAKNGQRIMASEYQESDLAHSKTQENQAEAQGVKSVGLTEQEIASGISLHRSSFFKCYTQLLQKNPTAKGEVSLSFTIENSGKLSVSDVTSNQLNFDDFKHCLTEVLRRVDFRPFSGPPISTLFPLKFE